LRLVIERIIVHDDTLEIQHVIPLRGHVPGNELEAPADIGLRSDGVRPAEGQRDGRIGRLGAAELLVGAIAVALQNAAIAAEQRAGVGVPPAGRVAVDHRRRLAAAPWPIVTRDCPEVALLGPPTTWVEHRHDGLVSEDPRGFQQHLA